MRINKIKKVIRHCSDRLFIQSAKYRVSDFDYLREGKKILLNFRVCLVKQETFPDLYTKPFLSGKELLFSTIHRSGPIGLFEAKSFDFIIIKISQSEESRIWKYLKEDMDGPSEEQILSFRDQPIIKDNGEVVTDTPQNKVAVSMSDISWYKYDVVISINFSVDESIVKQYPRILWCYILQEPSMRYYKNSIKQALFSYDLFLNQKFTYQFSKQQKHEVNFPYNFMSSQSFSALEENSFTERQGIFIEIHTAKNLTIKQMDQLRQLGGVRYPQEELFKNVLQKMQQSRYFFSLRGKYFSFKIWGNSMIDAVGAGLLAFGDPKEYHNLGLFTPFTIITSVEEFIHKIQFLEKEPLIYARELTLQQRLLNKYCFYNPIKKLRDAHQAKSLGVYVL
jgi:hypothetical protein